MKAVQEDIRRTQVGDPAKEALCSGDGWLAHNLGTAEADEHLGAVQRKAHGRHNEPLQDGNIGRRPEAAQQDGRGKGIRHHHLHSSRGRIQLASLCS